LELAPRKIRKKGRDFLERRLFLLHSISPRIILAQIASKCKSNFYKAQKVL